MLSYRHSMAVLHSSILLFSFSSVFGKWLTLPPTIIVFGRTFFAALALAIFIVLIKRQSLKVSRKIFIALSLIGVILAVHWVTFFRSVQVSNVPIAVVTAATFPLFVSLLEPIFLKHPFRKESLVQAVFTLTGVALVLPLQQIDSSIIEGIVWGTFSAFLFAILAILNSKYINIVSAKHLAFYQNLSASIVLLPFAIFLDFDITLTQVALLLLLGVICTAFAHTLYNMAFIRLKASTISIAVSLEPIHGITAAYLFLNQQLTIMMCVGAILVIVTNIWAAKAAKSYDVTTNENPVAAK